MRLVLPVPPSWNASYRSGKGRFYTPDTVLAFRKHVEVAFRNARLRKFQRDVPVSISFYWYRKRQAGDLDKRCSVAQDALQGLWFDNDAQIVEAHQYRFEDPAHPRLEVEVAPIAKEEAA